MAQGPALNSRWFSSKCVVEKVLKNLSISNGLFFFERCSLITAAVHVYKFS